MCAGLNLILLKSFIANKVNIIIQNVINYEYIRMYNLI